MGACQHRSLTFGSIFFGMTYILLDSRGGGTKSGTLHNYYRKRVERLTCAGGKSRAKTSSELREIARGTRASSGPFLAKDEVMPESC